MRNYGLIESTPNPTDWILGKEGTREVLQKDRDWSQFLPSPELQYIPSFDTYACVTFSAWNCIETLVKRKYQIELNKSDRFTAKMSDTIPLQGNTLNKVGDSIRNHWSVEEKRWPFTVKTSEEYYVEIPEEISDEAEKEKNCTVEYRWVGWNGCEIENLWDALAFGPLQVTVQTWGEFKDGKFQKPKTNETNHAVMIFKGKYGEFWQVYDHYDQIIKTLAWDYYFGSAMQYSLKKNMMELIKGDQRSQVFAIDNKGNRRYIYNEAQFIEGREIGLWGDWKDIETKQQSEVDALPEASPIIFGLK